MFVIASWLEENVDVMENPSPVPVRRQKYRRLHLYDMIPALVIGSAGSCGPEFEVCQNAGMPPANISTGGGGVEGGGYTDMQLHGK